MLIIGENINASRKMIREKLSKKDTAFFRDLATIQVQNGADMLDLNIGDIDPDNQPLMQWLVQTVQEYIDVPLCLDSPYPKLIRAGMESYNFKNGKPLVNSVTAEKDRIKSILPLVKQYQCSVVALAMDENGIPKNSTDRFLIAKELIKVITEFGIPPEDIYLDPLVIPISTNSEAATITLETLSLIKKNFPHINTIAGLSNISYGLPIRRNINQAFLPLLMQTGVNALILDPTDRKIISLLYSSQVLLGNDLYCKNYLQAYRNGLL